MIKSQKDKIILIGIDALDPIILNNLIKKNKLSHFSFLIKKGFYSELKTYKPAISPKIWTSIITGKLPEKHGIEAFEYCKIKGFKKIYINNHNNLRLPHYINNKHIRSFLTKIGLIKIYLPTSVMRKTKALWNILTENNFSSGVIGHWATWPAEPIKGFVVSEHVNFANIGFKKAKDGVERKSLQVTHPENLYDELIRFNVMSKKFSNELNKFFKFSDEDINLYDSVKKPDPKNPINMFKYNYCADKFNINTLFYLMDKYDCDFFTVLLTGLDGICHNLWRYKQPQFYKVVTKKDIKKFGKIIDNYYMHLDEFLGNLIKKRKDSTIIIISDHGFEYHGIRKEYSCDGHKHGPNGVLIMYGRKINHLHSKGLVTPCDVTPTILHLLGLPVAKDMDGEVISSAIKNSKIVNYIDSYENKLIKPDVLKSRRDTLILERLRSLGYGV